MPNYPEIAARLFGTPLMIHEGKAGVIARAFGPRVLGDPVAPVEMLPAQMGVIGEGLREAGDGFGESIYRGVSRIGDDIGHIEIEGTLVNKGKWIGQHSGMTSYEALGVQINDCKGDDTIRGVIVEVDSFGGEVTGAVDCAELLFELSQAKPTIAVLTDHACSAGYLMAAAARQVIIPVNGMAGSIGVISMHVDMSKWLAKEGLHVTIMKAGQRKADFNPYEPVPDDVLRRELANMEEIRADFAATVARFRRGRLTTKAALATEAGCFRGAAAVKAGLADAVARPSQVLAEFAAALSRKRNRPTQRRQPARGRAARPGSSARRGQRE